MASVPPQLPVPNLQDTLQKLLATIKVLVSEECYRESEQIIQEFGKSNGVGEMLQKLIQEKAKRTEYWLQDWAMNYKYLSNRNSLVYVTSPGLKLPIQEFTNDTEWLQYAAAVIQGSIFYKIKIDQNDLPIEKIGNAILDMGQYRNIFGSCRVPAKNVDDIVYNPKSRHIVVAFKNEFYKLCVYDPNTNKSLSKKNLFKLLKSIVDGQNKIDENIPIGILSGLPRDEYFTVYDLLSKDTESKQSIDTITSSLFLLCLDNEIEWDKLETSEDICRQLLHGGGSQKNSGNRWFDKTIQFIINRNGINGITYEHTLSEGQAIVNYTDYLIANHLNTVDENVEFDETYEFVSKLNFKITPAIEEYIQRAVQYIDQLSHDTVNKILHFKNYGKDFIKSQNLSPDSYIQMAFQYAYFKFHEIIGAQYETCHLRKFLHGRTEGIRACTSESIEFAQGMDNPDLSTNEKKELLIAATTVHKHLINNALNGQGIEKHLSGIKLIAKENGIPHPDMFECDGFKRANTFEMETSQVASPNQSFMFYGPIYKANYAICYNPRNQDIYFIISTLKYCTSLDVEGLAKHLEEALIKMKDLLTSTN